MLPFLFRFGRENNVRLFADLYTREVAKYPQALIGFIGHSNGTYIAANALQRYGMIKIDHVVFANSVVPQGYDWDSKVASGRVTKVANFMGHSDKVVASVPRCLEKIYEKRQEVGSGGFAGFLDNAGKEHEVLLRGGHNAGIKPKMFPALVQFALNGEHIDFNDPENQKLVRKKRGFLTNTIWKFPRISCFLIVVALAIIGYLIAAFISPWGIPVYLFILLIFALQY